MKDRMLKTELVKDIKAGNVLYFEGKSWKVTEANPCNLFDLIIQSGTERLYLDRVYLTKNRTEYYYRVLKPENNQLTFSSRLLPFQFVIIQNPKG